MTSACGSRSSKWLEALPVPRRSPILGQRPAKRTTILSTIAVVVLISGTSPAHPPMRSSAKRQRAHSSLMGLYETEQARHRVAEQQMAAMIRQLPCHPPSEDEVATAKSTLRDFVVIRAKGSSTTIERPTSHEE